MVDFEQYYGECKDVFCFKKIINFRVFYQEYLFF